MKYSYKKLYEKTAAFFNARPNAKKALSVFDRVLTISFGLAYIALWVYGAVWGKFSAHNFIRIFFVPALSLFFVSILRTVIARPRPYSQAGAGISPLKERKGSEDNSFPSRHLACAASIAICFFPALPIVGAVMLAFCVGLGYIRFALGFHYPSDLLAGGAVGFIVAGLYSLLEFVFSFL